MRDERLASAAAVAGKRTLILTFTQLMDAPLKELAKLEKLATAKGKGPSILSALDDISQSLQRAKDQVQAGSVISPEQFVTLTQTIEAKKKEVDERQKEVYSATSRFGKALDKVCRMSESIHCLTVR